jgi:glucan-binding YG repeat protein
MRNSKKIALIMGLASMAAIGSAFAAFAASGWQYTNEGWRYFDSSGEPVTDSWKKSGNDTYYLDDSGYMATEKLIDKDGYYYVNEDGVRVTDTWMKLQSDDDDDPHWYYFTSSGKAKEEGFSTIKGHKYHFTDSKMDTGWFDDDKGNTYYFGNDDEGWAHSGWLDYDGLSDDADSKDREEGWYYFNPSSGKLYTNCEKKINGYYYAFNDDGKMLNSWVSFDKATSSNATPSNEVYKYFQDPEGNRKNGWVKIEDYESDDITRSFEEGWYYLKNGQPYSTSYKTTLIDDGVGFATINGKTYAFDDNGKMYTGVILAGGHYYYFGNDDDGAMKTGKNVIKDSDIYEGETMFFAKSGSIGAKGASVTGVYNSYLYNEGLLVEGDSKYSIVTVDGLTYLITEKGKVVTTGTVKDTDAHIKYTVKKNSEGGYDITSEAY